MTSKHSDADFSFWLRGYKLEHSGLFAFATIRESASRICVDLLAIPEHQGVGAVIVEADTAVQSLAVNDAVSESEHGIDPPAE
jgi:hypothetical protein